MFEHRSKPLISHRAFAQRMLGWLAATLFLIAVSLGLGMAGYHVFAGLPWIDAFLNAAMILGGMGEVDILRSDSGKIFAGLYAIYCGFFMIVCAGLFLAPVFHRVLHHFHADHK